MKDKHFNILRWMPLAGSLALVGLIAIVCGLTVKELQEAIFWRKHTFQVILEAQTEEDDLIAAQSRIHRFAVEGTPNLLIEYQNETNSELQEFKRLTELTRDNSEQQERLKDLNSALNAVFQYDNKVIGVYARHGSEAALKTESDGARVLDTAVKDVERFKKEERRLLDKRDTLEQADFHKAAYVLIIGSIVAAVLLVVANFYAGREMSRRREAEAKQRTLIEELQKALTEVKTLSGLIPICAWCKSVRSDKGFWQTVEHYLSSHTDAKLSHGMCPTCTEKWNADAAKV